MGYCRQHRQLQSQHSIQHQAFSPSPLTQRGTVLPAALSGPRKGGSRNTGREGVSSPPLCPLTHSTLHVQLQLRAWSINTYMLSIRQYLEVSSTEGQG